MSTSPKGPCVGGRAGWDHIRTIHLNLSKGSSWRMMSMSSKGPGVEEESGEDVTYGGVMWNSPEEFVVCTTHVANRPLPPLSFLHMGWIQLVGSLKLQVSFAEFSLFDRALLQKRPVILKSLLIVATPYLYMSLPYNSAIQHQCKSAGVLQSVAVCCSVLKFVAGCCSVLLMINKIIAVSYDYGVATIRRLLKM